MKKAIIDAWIGRKQAGHGGIGERFAHGGIGEPLSIILRPRTFDRAPVAEKRRGIEKACRGEEGFTRT